MEFVEGPIWVRTEGQHHKMAYFVSPTVASHLAGHSPGGPSAKKRSNRKPNHVVSWAWLSRQLVHRDGLVGGPTAEPESLELDKTAAAAAVAADGGGGEVDGTETEIGAATEVVTVNMDRHVVETRGRHWLEVERAAWMDTDRPVAQAVHKEQRVVGHSHLVEMAVRRPRWEMALWQQQVQCYERLSLILKQRPWVSPSIVPKDECYCHHGLTM